MSRRLSAPEARDLVAARHHSHPPGLLAGTTARMGCALHTQTRTLLDLHAHTPHTPWVGHTAHATDTPAQPVFTHPHDSLPWRPARFARAQKLSLHAPLTLDTLPAHPLQHRAGGRYIGVAVAHHEGQFLAIYADQHGLWWARPWAMFADGRFTSQPAQLVPWPAILETTHA